MEILFTPGIFQSYLWEIHTSNLAVCKSGQSDSSLGISSLSVKGGVQTKRDLPDLNLGVMCGSL